MCVKLLQSCLTLSDPMYHCPPGSSVHGDSLGKNTGVGCHALLHGIFLTQGSNQRLLHCRLILYQLSHQGGPNMYVFNLKLEKKKKPKTTQTKKQPPCLPARIQSSSWHFEKTQCVQATAFCSACICHRPPSMPVQFQSDSMVQNKDMNLGGPTISLSSSCLTWPAQPVPTLHPQYK